MAAADDVTRRYLIQALGATGAAALAGCAGDGSDSNPEQTPTDENTTTPAQTTEANPYELPESEHIEPDDFMLEWMLLAPGNEFEGVSYSPSKLHENYETTLLDEIEWSSTYDKFEFSVEDIPESFVEKHPVENSPTVKVDQLPNNVSEGDVVQQLQDTGYSKDREKGDLEVYTARGNKHPHAVGKGKHIVGWVYSAPLDRANGVIDNFIEQETENELTPGEDVREGISAMNVQDSITLTKGGTFMPMDQEYQPEIAASSANFQEGSRYGAWVFEDEETANAAYARLQNEDIWGGYDSLEQDGRFITAAEGEYSSSEINSDPLLISGTAV